MARNYFGFDEMVDEVMSCALDALRHSGATLVDPAEISSIEKVSDAEQTVLLYELKADLAAYFARLGPKTPVHALKDVIEFNGAIDLARCHTSDRIFSSRPRPKVRWRAMNIKRPLRDAGGLRTPTALTP